MKSNRTVKRTAANRIIGLLALAIFSFTSINAWAHAPRARARQCVVQTLEPNSRAMTLRCGKDAEALELAWTKQTRFVKDWQFADSAQVRPGQRVTVYYHSPFFGKKFATKVVWQSSQNDKLNMNQSTKSKEI